MKIRSAVGLFAVVLMSATASVADPVSINDDEGYARLSRWESHLDQRISSGLQQRSINPYQAWRLQ